MTAINIHLQRIKEHLEELEDAIRIGMDRRPATIGMHCSACMVDLLETFLHKSNNIATGAVIKHEWFKRPSPGQKVVPLAERQIPAEFSGKKDIFEQMYGIEERRNKLIYGKATPADTEITLKHFLKLKEMMLPLLGAEGIHLEP